MPVFGQAGAILRPLGCSQQSGEQMQVVDVHIVEGAPLAGRIKGGVPDACKKSSYRRLRAQKLAMAPRTGPILGSSACKKANWGR